MYNDMRDGKKDDKEMAMAQNINELSVSSHQLDRPIKTRTFLFIGMNCASLSIRDERKGENSTVYLQCMNEYEASLK